MREKGEYFVLLKCARWKKNCFLCSMKRTYKRISIKNFNKDHYKQFIQYLKNWESLELKVSYEPSFVNT